MCIDTENGGYSIRNAAVPAYEKAQGHESCADARQNWEVLERPPETSSQTSICTF